MPAAPIVTFCSTPAAPLPTPPPPQVIERLTERRIALEKAVATLGEAPSGLRDVFELCRGFERAFTTTVNESPAANRIKEAFFGDRGLAGQVQKLPLEKAFDLESMKRTNKTADGYQPHLVSPERGLRLMAAKALDQVGGPVAACVSAVYSMLVGAAREAAAAAGENTEAAMSGKVPLNVPEFRNFIMPAVVRALDEWRTEAETSECRLFGGWGLGVGGEGKASAVVWRACSLFNDAPPAHCIYSSQPNTATPASTPPITAVAKMLVDMERSYITAGFFRYTMGNRFASMQQTNALQQALAKGPGGRSRRGLPGFLPGGGGATAEGQQPPANGPATAGGQPPPLSAAPSGRSLSGGTAPSYAMNLSSLTDPSDYLASHLDKKVNEDSARGSLPVQGWRWQRRFFIVSDSQRALFYFKSESVAVLCVLCVLAVCWLRWLRC